MEAETDFSRALTDSLHRGTFRKLTLSRPLPAAGETRQIRARLIELRGSTCISIVTRTPTNDLTQNLSPAEAAARLAPLPGSRFRSAHLYSTEATWQLDYSKKGRPMLRRSAAEASEMPPRPHDRPKQHPLSAGAPWLHRLGVTDEHQRVRASMADKWRQLQKFVEVLDQILPETLPEGIPPRLVDVGCGRGLLTFAAYDRLRHKYGPEAQVLGIELREHLTRDADAVARRLGLDGLRFQAQDIRSLSPEPCLGVIALHACDTATDVALFCGIRDQAAFLLSSPCCHKELRPQIRIPPVLAPMLRHGTHLGLEAEMLTDSLRMLLLAEAGYACRIVEFVSLEHTAKNKLIVATRARPHPTAREEFRELCAFYSIGHQSLDVLLREHREKSDFSHLPSCTSS